MQWYGFAGVIPIRATLKTLICMSLPILIKIEVTFMIEPVIDIDATMGKEFRYLSHVEKYHGLMKFIICIQ